MRGRAWRRHIEEKFIIRRLKKHSGSYGYWYCVEDVNKNYFKKSLIIDFLEKQDYFYSKTISTTRWDSRDKSKYSPNRNTKGSWGRPGNTPDTREWNRRYLLKTLKENGLK